MKRLTDSVQPMIAWQAGVVFLRLPREISTRRLRNFVSGIPGQGPVKNENLQLL
jgi:hypothetical protein